MSKIATILLLLVVMLVSVGCNKTDTPPATYGVYVKSVTVEEDVCTVRLSRSGKGESLQDSVIAVEEVSGSFFDTYIYTVSFDGGATFSAVDNLLTQDGTILDGEEYSTLKIVYEGIIYVGRWLAPAGRQRPLANGYHYSRNKN